MLGASFVALVVLVSVYAAGAGVRGSDQYWYLKDVETLIRAGTTTTNTVFPVGLLGPGGTLSPPFIHNVLSVYLAALPASITGAHGGWLVLNVAATLGAAGLIYLAARTVASRWAAVVCAVCYPVLPVTFWHMAQPLAEASTAFFAALAIYLLAIAGIRTGRWLAVVGAVGLLYLSRESYLPLLLAVPAAYLIVRLTEGRSRLRESLAPTAVLAAAALAVVAVERTFLGTDNVAFSYARLLQTAVPGRTDNMWFNFDLSSANLADRLPMAWDVLPVKLMGHLADQFIRFDSIPVGIFYWVFNLLVLVALGTAWRCRRRPAALRLVLAALSMVVIHAATITLFQNEVRYTVPALPGLLVVAAIGLSEMRWLERLVAPRLLAVVVLLVGSLLVPTAWVAHTMRMDAQASRSAERATRMVFDTHLQAYEGAMVVWEDAPQVFAYSAGDRPILYVSAAYDRTDFERLRTAFPTRWLFAPLDSPAIAGLGASPEDPVGTVEDSGVRWGLFALPGSS